MIGTQDKRLSVAEHDVKPMEEAGIGIVGFVFMGEAIQGRNVAAITIGGNIWDSFFWTVPIPSLF